MISPFFESEVWLLRRLGKLLEEILLILSEDRKQDSGIQVL
jgi:hypothetical protein